MENRSNSKVKWKYFTFVTAFGFAVFAAAASAWAVGTTAGTTISNQATITYQVDGTEQPEVTSDDPNVAGIQATQFVVDRMVDLMVSNVPVVPGNYVNVPSGATSRVLTFTVSNTGNAPFNFELNGYNFGTDPFGGTDVFDITVSGWFVDSDGSGATGGGYVSGAHTFDALSDTATTIDTLPADQMINVYVVCDIPTGRSADEVAAVVLAAIAREPGTGAALPDDSGNAWAQTSMQTINADGTGVDDNAGDADYSAAHAFRIIAANLAAAKAVEIVDDYVSAGNYKAIPGALVRYTITVTNTGATAASSVNIADYVPANVTLTGTRSVSNNNASVTPTWEYSISAAVPPAQPASGEWAAWPPGNLSAVTWVRTIHSTIDAATGEAVMTLEATID